jgi:hypothetical protein
MVWYIALVASKTNSEHFFEMVINAVYANKIKAKRILFESWYASAENLKLVHRLGLTFFTTLISNRMVVLIWVVTNCPDETLTT